MEDSDLPVPRLRVNNYEQTHINYKGDSMEANCSAVPIKGHARWWALIDDGVIIKINVTERRLS